MRYIFARPIHPNQSTKFKIKIIQIREPKNMYVGVVDYEKQENKMSYSAGRDVYPNPHPGDKYQGNGFKEGDFVEVDVSRSTRTVKYRVNDKLEATQTH